MIMIELIKQRRANRRGFALSFATVMVLILSFVGFGILRLGMETRMRAVRTAAQISARSAADAGLTKAVFEMNKNLDVDWNFNDMVSPAAAVFSSANANYNYTIEETAKDAAYTITSTGQSGLTSETISATVVVQGIFNYAVYAQGYAIPKQPKPHRHKDGEGPRPPKPLKKGGKFEITGYSVDGTYSSGAEAYSGPIKLRTNNVHKKSVKLRENVVVNGDIVIGPGGDPDKVVELKDGAVITGDIYAATERQELLSVSVPGSLENQTLEDYEYQAGVPITGNNKYSSLIIPKDGVQEIKGSAGVINESQDPTNLLIFGLDACRKVKIESPVDFYGAVYAPFAKVEMKTGGDLYGAFVGWDVKLKKKKGEGDGIFYYDRSLRIGDLLATDGLAARFVVKRWQQQ